jgi:hypothetical protein
VHHTFGWLAVNAAGTGRLVVGLLALAVLALLVWRTMEPGNYQKLTWLLLGFFAMRMVLGWLRARRPPA